MVFEMVLKRGLAVAPVVFTQDKNVMHQFMAYAPRHHFLAVLLNGSRRNADLHLILGKFVGRILKTHARKRRHMPVQHQPGRRQIAGRMSGVFDKIPHAVDHVIVNLRRRVFDLLKVISSQGSA